jgi:tetratricopeptide (TPR) repeat protein
MATTSNACRTGSLRQKSPQQLNTEGGIDVKALTSTPTTLSRSDAQPRAQRMSPPNSSGLQLQDRIGAGSCGEVFRATADGRVCAVKRFSAMSINRRALEATLQRLATLPPHPGILPVEQFEIGNGPCQLVMPLLGNLERDASGQRSWQAPTLEPLCTTGVEPERAWHLIHAIAEALAWLHRHGLIHGNLRPANVFIDPGPPETPRLTDLAQGWVGGVHRLELTDHFLHLAPEQAENPDGVFQGLGPGADVYSFGVLAYRLLVGRLPRGAAAWAEQSAIGAKKVATGLAWTIDQTALLAAVRAQPKVEWPAEPADKWEERQRHILERCLDLNPAARWADMREVLREFEVMEADRQIETNREWTAQEHRNQARRVLILQILATGLAALLVAGGAVAFLLLHQARQSTQAALNEVADLRTSLATLEQRQREQDEELARARASMQAAETRRGDALAAVDQFLTLLLEQPAGSELESALVRSQLDDALRFCLASLPALEADPALGLERLRVYANLGRIHLRLREPATARDFLEKARKEGVTLLRQPPAEAGLIHTWQGRTCLLLADLHERRAETTDALERLQEAVHSLGEGLTADPANRSIRQELARAWLQFAQLSRQQGALDEASKALTRVRSTLDPKHLAPDALPEEQFLLARSRFTEGQIQRDAGQGREAINTLLEAVTEMGKLVAGSSPSHQGQALQLAEAYTELAELIARQVGPKEAREAHDQAVPILLELNRLHPEWADVKFLIARNYGAISLLERDLGNREAAVKKKQDAIELINELLADEADNPRLRALQTRLRGEYAELMSDLGKPEAALPILEQAIAAALELLADKEGTRLTLERRAAEIQLAQMYGVLGHTRQSLKQTTAAKAAFTTALERWQKLASLLPGDETIRQGQTWTRERLAKLK